MAKLQQPIPKGIRRRGDAWMVDCTISGVRRTATCDTLEAAIIKQAELKLSATAPAQAPAKAKWTLAHALDRTIKTEWKDTRGARSAIPNAKLALSFFGDKVLLEDITTDMIDDYIEHLEDSGRSNGTINRKLAALSKLFTVAIDRGALQAKPKFRRKPEAMGRIRYITRTEEQSILRLLSQFADTEAHDAVIVLVDTGLRWGELQRLTVRDIDWQTGMLSVWVNKADLPRSVPMTQRVRSLLLARATAQPVGLLFSLPTYWAIRGPWQRMKVAMGLVEDEQFTPHCLRHTFCSRLVQSGVGIETVQKLAGHKTLSITLRYSHLAPANLTEAIAKLEQSA
jgi:integrase